MIKIKPALRGLLSYIPFLLKIIRKGKGSIGTGGTNSARYCYSVWMRHLIYLRQNGMKGIPRIVAELGPGDSIGIGLAALISGSSEYYAFDIIEHSNVENNLIIFDDLVELFKKKEPIPNEFEFPLVKPILDNYEFPYDVFKDIDYNFLLNPERIETIRETVKNGSCGDFKIQYIVPWYDRRAVGQGEVDLIFSQAVLEHIIELDFTYKKMSEWLKTGGYISHEIDYSAHETSNVWNGHWAYSNFLWKIIMHGRSYPINRNPHSVHKRLISESRLNIICEIPSKSNNGYKPDKLNGNFKKFPIEDYSIQSCFIQAVK